MWLSRCVFTLLLVSALTVHAYMHHPYNRKTKLCRDSLFSLSSKKSASSKESTQSKCKKEPKVIARKPALTSTGSSTISTSIASRQNSWKSLIKKLDETKSDVRYAKQNNAATIASLDAHGTGFDNKLSHISLKQPLTKLPPKYINIPSNKDELKCIHFEDCSGCTVKSDFTNTPVMQQARLFFQRVNIPFNIHVGNITGWRTHVKLAVQPMSKWGGLKFGLYRMNSHDVEAIPQCRVQHPILNEAAEHIRIAALDAGVKGYVPATAKAPASGELRYLQLSLERSTGKVQVVLVWNAEMAQDAITSLPRLVKLMKSRHSDLWHSITVNFNTMSTNNIFDYEPKKWRLLWGLPYLKEQVHNATLYFKPQIFRQANLDVFGDAIIPFVAKYIPPESVVAELYAGIGLMGINLARRAKTVLCSDSNTFVADVFDRCCTSSLSPEDNDKIFFECLDAVNAVKEGQCDDAEVLLIDPPRRGLHETITTFLLDQLEEKKLPNTLKRVVYVSCGYHSLENDCRVLTASKLWKIRAAEGFALFPGSDHVETVVVLDRVNSNNKI